METTACQPSDKGLIFKIPKNILELSDKQLQSNWKKNGEYLNGYIFKNDRKYQNIYKIVFTTKIIREISIKTTMTFQLTYLEWLFKKNDKNCQDKTGEIGDLT